MKIKLLLLVYFLNVVAYAFWGPLLTAYAITLNANPGLAGSLFAFFTLCQALSVLFFGKLDNKNNRITLIVSGYVAQGLSALLFISISNPVFLFLPLMTSALGGGMIAPSWKALYSRSLTLNKEGKEWSYYDAGTYLAIASGVFMGGFLANYYGYKAIFTPLLAINIIAALVLFSKRNLLK